MALGGFGMIILLSRAGFEAEQLDDFKGLNERSPWFAFMMVILMFSMAGVPPTVGFWAKFAVLESGGRFDMAVAGRCGGDLRHHRRVLLPAASSSSCTSTGRRPRAPLAVPRFDMRSRLSVNGLAVLALGLFPGAPAVGVHGGAGLRRRHPLRFES